MGPLEAAFLWRRLQAALSRKPCYGPFPPMRLTFHLRSSFRVLPLVASSCPVLRLILRRMMRNCRSFGDYSFLRLTDSLKCDWYLFLFCDPVFRILCHLSCGLYRGHLFACALSFLTENDVQFPFLFCITSNSEIDLGIFSHVIMRRVICPTGWLKFCTDFIQYLILKVCCGRIFHSQNCGLDVMGT